MVLQKNADVRRSKVIKKPFFFERCHLMTDILSVQDWSSRLVVNVFQSF